MSKRYFINNFDTFIGQGLIKELIKEDIEEPTLMATYKDITKFEKPKNFKKILKREKPKLSRKKMLEESDVYIYDLHFCDKNDITFVVDCLKNANLEEQKVLIIVSNIMTWANTLKKEKIEVKEPENPEEGVKDPEDSPIKPENENKPEEEPEAKEESGENHENENDENLDDQQDIKNEEGREKPKEYLPFKEEDYKERIPHEEYLHFKEMEDLALSLQKENLKVIIICSGILYGQGEIVFHKYFEAAWLQNPLELPIKGNGENLIPMIHISDLCKFIIKIAENPSESNYLLALDNSKIRSQRGIIESISKGIGSGKTIEVEELEVVGKEFENLIKIDIDMTPSKLLVDEENPPDFEWTSEKGLSMNTEKVLQEFNKFMNLRPLKILMFCEEKFKDELNLTKILNKLSSHYRIPILYKNEIIKEALENGDEELKIDLQEELININEYLEKKEEIKLNESTKVLFRTIKWRLSQNDCKNRGYILVNFPMNSEETNYIFTKCNLKKKKKKIIKKKEDNLENQELADVMENEENENKEENNEEGELEEEVAEEEENVEQNEEEGDEENKGPKKENFYPESVILLRRLLNFEDDSTSIFNSINYFENRNIDLYLLDSCNKEEFEIFENLKIYIERNGTPFNYLLSEDELKRMHFEYYENKSKTLQENKEKLKSDEDLIIEQAKIKREQNAIEQVKFIIDNEINCGGTNNLHFRDYLMEFIVPYLTSGLLEVTYVKPQDPVEFLAEYIYKKSFEL